MDDGTETHFDLDGQDCYVFTSQGDGKRAKLTHELYVDDEEVAVSMGDRMVASEVGMVASTKG